MKRMDCVVIATVAVLGATVAISGADDLSLEDALQRAADNNPQVAAAAAGVEATEYGRKVAGADAWPTLSASGSYGKFSGDVLYGRFIPGAPGDGVVPVGEYDTNKLVNVELTQVLYAGPYGAERKVWSARGRDARFGEALNPYGDFNGDLFPTVAESSVAPYAPLVVWSRFNATEYDLAWSTWTRNGWSEISAVWLTREISSFSWMSYG